MSPLPDLHSKFMEFMVERNRPRMDGFRQWVLQPGMRFQAAAKWWGNRGHRAAPHEGLDLYSFEDANGRVKTLDRHTQIPAAFAGEVAKVEPDFLGQSIYLRHASFSAGGDCLFSIYGHTVPRSSIQTGQQVAEGEVIGVISTFPGKKTSLSPHLHITFAWVPVGLPLDHLDWKNLGQEPAIILVDPLEILVAPDSRYGL
jgi:murein DD-endopeptidase MepM/ murein hydrolase activator NlpD